jgi:hypothetical protein
MELPQKFVNKLPNDIVEAIGSVITIEAVFPDAKPKAWTVSGHVPHEVIHMTSVAHRSKTLCTFVFEHAEIAEADYAIVRKWCLSNRHFKVVWSPEAYAASLAVSKAKAAANATQVKAATPVKASTQPVCSGGCGEKVGKWPMCNKCKAKTRRE